MTILTAAQVRALLLSRVRASNWQAVADDLGVHQMTLRRAVGGDTVPGDKLLAALGLEPRYRFPKPGRTYRLDDFRAYVEWLAKTEGGYRPLAAYLRAPGAYVALNRLATGRTVEQKALDALGVTVVYAPVK